jgi:hypothetical protein
MSFEELVSAVMSLSVNDQRRFIIEVLPRVWPRACVDDACVAKVRELVDEATVREYKRQHVDHI